MISLIEGTKITEKVFVREPVINFLLTTTSVYCFNNRGNDCGKLRDTIEEDKNKTVKVVLIKTEKIYNEQLSCTVERVDNPNLLTVSGNKH